MSTDAQLYLQTEKIGLARRLSLTARQRIFAAFMREMSPDPNTRILDIGASDYEAPEANLLEKAYPYPHNITCGTIGSVDNISALHPAIEVVSLVPGEPLPFRDKSFDIAYSNAVLEHVGGREERIAFIKEAQRVAKTVFFVVPNRWFPIEHHTAMPLLHYTPGLFRAVMARTHLKFWSDKQVLDFLSSSQISREWPDRKPTISYDGIRLGPFSSNLVVVSR